MPVVSFRKLERNHGKDVESKVVLVICITTGSIQHTILCRHHLAVSYLYTYTFILEENTSHFAGVVNGIACYEQLKAVVLCTRVFESHR